MCCLISWGGMKHSVCLSMYIILNTVYFTHLNFLSDCSRSYSFFRFLFCSQMICFLIHRDKRSEVVSWQVCVATCYRPCVGVNPPLDQTYGHLNVEARNDFCRDGFKLLYELWHFNVTRAKLCYISLGTGNSRRENFQGNALYSLILRLYALLQRARVLSWKIDGRWIAAFVKMPFYVTVIVQIQSDVTDNGWLSSSTKSNG